RFVIHDARTDRASRDVSRSLLLRKPKHGRLESQAVPRYPGKSGELSRADSGRGVPRNSSAVAEPRRQRARIRDGEWKPIERWKSIIMNMQPQQPTRGATITMQSRGA